MIFEHMIDVVIEKEKIDDKYIDIIINLFDSILLKYLNGYYKYNIKYICWSIGHLAKKNDEKLVFETKIVDSLMKLFGNRNISCHSSFFSLECVMDALYRLINGFIILDLGTEKRKRKIKLYIENGIIDLMCNYNNGFVWDVVDYWIPLADALIHSYAINSQQAVCVYMNSECEIL